MTKFEKCILCFILLLLVALVSFQARDLIGKQCQKECYNYCNEKTTQIIDGVNNKLDEYIFEDIE